MDRPHNQNYDIRETVVNSLLSKDEAMKIKGMSRKPWHLYLYGRSGKTIFAF